MTLDELGFTKEVWPKHYSVKEAVFPFLKFPGVDTILGPEMLSTGEVMGIANEAGIAYARARSQQEMRYPPTGRCCSASRLRINPEPLRPPAIKPDGFKSRLQRNVHRAYQ